MSGHTPGPWTIHQDEIWGPTEPKGHDGRLGRIRGFTDEDARLIAAAPELLDACREAIGFLYDGTPDDGVSPYEQSIRKNLRDAIAKAEGTPEPVTK